MSLSKNWLVHGNRYATNSCKTGTHIHITHPTSSSSSHHPPTHMNKGFVRLLICFLLLCFMLKLKRRVFSISSVTLSMKTKGGTRITCYDGYMGARRRQSWVELTHHRDLFPDLEKTVKKQRSSVFLCSMHVSLTRLGGGSVVVVVVVRVKKGEE